MAEPSATGLGKQVGSEAEIAHLLRDFRYDDENHIYSHPSLHELRSTGTFNWILVDDMIGSGARAYKMLEWVYEHPTVKSWRSFGCVRLTVFAFAGTSKGIKRVRSHRAVDEVIVLHQLGRGSPAWSAEITKRVEILCKKYCFRHLEGCHPLGYGEAFTNLVFEHSCPNTSPAILYRRGSSWTPLFDKRPVASQAIWPTFRDSNKQKREILAAVRQGKLADRISSNLLNEGDRLLLMTLSLAYRHRGRPEALAVWLTVSPKQAELLISRCKEFGWISSRNYLTDQGKAILHQARSLPTGASKMVPLKIEPYTPHNLR